jgi:putative redox protein
VATAKALVRHVSGHTLLAKGPSNHWVPLETNLEQSPAAANDPVQLMLMACAGCVMLDTVDMLKKAHQEPTHFEIEIDGLRRDTMPKIFRRLDYRVRMIGSNLLEESVRRAIELSLTRYCSVSLSLERSVKFFAQLTLNGETGDPWEIARQPDLYKE